MSDPEVLQSSALVTGNVFLNDATDQLELIQQTQLDSIALKAAFDSLASRQERIIFLTFLSDQQIIEAGIFPDVPAIVSSYPNLRY